MTTPQSGITPEANSDALFLVLNVQDSQDSLLAIRQTCALIPELTRTYAEQYPDARISSTISIGSRAWDMLYNHKKPALLRPFIAVTDGHRSAPSTAGDLLLHIRSNRKDINFLLQKNILEHFGDNVQIEQDVSGFRHLESRDLTGFVDGTENPEGENRATVAIVGDEDPEFAGGSYIHSQKYIHNLKQWNHLEVPQQEKIIGRSKADNIEFSSEEKAPTAHVKRANIKDAHGKGMEILRHSMPFGNATEAGLYFISYCRTPSHFDQMLEVMIKADQHGHYDHLMDFSTAVTGGAFFAPSIEFLKKP